MNNGNIHVLAICMTAAVITMITHEQANGEGAFNFMAHTVGFVTVDKQVYEKVSNGAREQLVEIWYHDPIAKQQRPKTQTESGTYFSLDWHGNQYLVTAKHVILDGAGKPADRGVFYFNEKDGKRKSLTFEFMEDQEGSRWFLHDSADVAIHPMWRPVEIQPSLVAISTKTAETNTIQLPSILDSVYAIGFPLSMGVGESLNPIAKECKIASLKQELSGRSDSGLPISGTFILLDQALAQGYSGAPIYSCPAQNKLCLLGLMSSVNTDATGGKISLVVPIDYVIEVLKSTQFKAYEKLHGFGRSPKLQEIKSQEDVQPAASLDALRK